MYVLVRRLADGPARVGEPGLVIGSERVIGPGLEPATELEPVTELAAFSLPSPSAFSHALPSGASPAAVYFLVLEETAF